MRCDILGVPFDCLTLPQAVERALSFLGGENAHTVVTPNAEIVWLACRDAALLRALRAADMVLPDGVGVVRAARKLGHPITQRVSGIDFAEALLPTLAERGIPVFFYGGKPGVAEEAAKRMEAAHPGLPICGTLDGYSYADAPEDVAEAVRESGAHALFVCLGAPKQELFMRRYGVMTGARLLVGLGGALDVWAGNVKRAPKLFIRLGLEWLYRILRQPKRIVRVFRLPAFMLKVRKYKTKGIKC
ncbi:MAG: WecB/TagA/CpsF family glycosyltransferase [Oscillospiraceae bacterium]|nr:WecB/TagA/CpsF family glycosyltransferase [Oscillospiraceae bacterium]